jgi:hypothetical protein
MSTVFSGGPSTSVEEPKEQFGKFFSSEKQATFVALTVVCVLATLAYSSILFNWFAGDDFVHLVWLKEAVKNPELIVRNFHSSWLDGTTTKFYRPLISIFMVTDYLLTGTNGIAFHLTNLFFLLASSMLLFFIVKDLQNATTKRTSFWFPLMAAGLFALYPLHPEAVAWITGRVDAIVTAFFLASMWCYMRWRTKRGGIILPIIFMVLGLTSKEMAIILPATFLLYELCIGYEWKKIPGPKDIINMVKPTAPFWLLLVAYFGVRRWALGTFVGGYDDDLYFISNWGDFIGGWLHGLRMLLIPVNRTLMGDHNGFTIGWEIVALSSFVLGLYNCYRNKGLIRCAAFFVIWTAFCLAPVYKIFAIADDMQGSRLAYLATVPIAAGLALAFADGGNKSRWVLIGKRVLFVAFWFLAGALLFFNNAPWAQAGRETNAIRKGLVDFYSSVPGDPQVMLVGLPDEIHGAYVCRNAVAGMTTQPQFPRTLQNCLMVNKFEPILPVGFLKNSIAEHRDKIKVARWNPEKGKFEEVAIPNTEDLKEKSSRQWSGKELDQIVYGGGETKIVDVANGGITLQTNNTHARPTMLIKPVGLPCFNTDFLQINLKGVQENGPIKHPGADLVFTNDLLPDTDFHNRVHANLELSDKPQTVLFPLRALPDFALGGSIHAFRLLFPEATKVTVESVEIVPASKIMPSINFENSNYLGTKGFLHLGKDKQQCKISYDASGVKNAESIVFEITRPNLLFSSQNTAEASTVLMKKPEGELKGNGKTTGTITLERKNFGPLGLYEGTAWAIDKNGTRIGIAGDHIVIAVDS